MSELSDIRDGFKTVVETAIAGLRVYTYPTDGVLEYPCLVLEPTPDLDYNITIDAKSLEFILEATLYLRHGNRAQAWKELDEYRSVNAAKSIKAAVATGPTLNAKADDAVVMESSNVTTGRDDNEAIQEYSVRFAIRVLKGGL